jgi:hypothetical protein
MGASDSMTRSTASGRLLTLVYYLAVLIGLFVLYGTGDAPTTGFIYQSF